MAVYTYGTTNISWSSTDSWANEVAGLSNISVSGSAYSWADQMYALPSTDISAGTHLRSQALFFGTVSAGPNGSVRVSYPYTTSYSTGTITVKNVNLSTYTNVQLQASPTYPYIFQKWTTTNSSGGTSISTSTTLTLNASSYVSNNAFYAWFTVPASKNITVKFSFSSGTEACNLGVNFTLYYSALDAGNWYDAYKLYTDSALINPAQPGWYCDAVNRAYVYVDDTGAPGIPVFY